MNLIIVLLCQDIVLVSIVLVSHKIVRFFLMDEKVTDILKKIKRRVWFLTNYLPWVSSLLVFNFSTSWTILPIRVLSLSQASTSKSDTLHQRQHFYLSMQCLRQM